MGCFLFSDEDQYKKSKYYLVERNQRVALAKTLISEANFLLLDEPTNHLDFISENILIQALQQYAGSFIVVSHNRYFVSHIANKIWYIEDKQIKEIPRHIRRIRNTGERKMKARNLERKKAEPVQPKKEQPVKVSDGFR